MTTDNETETEEEENDALMPMVEQAMQKHKTAFEKMKMNLIHSCLDKQSAGESKTNYKISIWSASCG